MRVDYALLIALLTAIVDILPVLGTGTVLIPVSYTHLDVYKRQIQTLRVGAYV